MNKILLYLLPLLAIHFFNHDVFAQQLDTLNINNVKALVNSSGHLFKNTSFCGFKVPASSETCTIYTAGSFFSVKNLNDEDSIRCAGVLHYSDFIPGPLSEDGNLFTNQQTQNDFNRLWHAKRSEFNEFISYHQALIDGTVEWVFPDGYTIPEWILTWPSNGNNALQQPSTLAPFGDINGNSIYEPLQGDYPVFYGDECIYYILNDNSPVHNLTGGSPMGIEVHAMIYAFNSTDESVNNSVFVRYSCINRSNNNYIDFNSGLWVDFDLGASVDDYIGCNVEQGYYYVFNGDNFDDLNTITHGYGENPPIQIVAVTKGPKLPSDGIDNSLPAGYEDYESYGKYGSGFNDGIIDNELAGLNSFIYHNIGGNPVNGDPHSDMDFHNFFTGRWKNGANRTYGANGAGGGVGATDIPCVYMFPDASDPLFQNTNGIEVEPWSEISTGNIEGDRRGIGTTSAENFNAGDTITVEYVFLTAFSANNDSLTLLEVDDYLSNLRSFYSSSDMNEDINLLGAQTSTIELENKKNSRVRIFPNPTTEYLWIDSQNKKINQVCITNQNGQQVMDLGVIEGLNSINVEALSTGLYQLQFESNGVNHSYRFIKL